MAARAAPSFSFLAFPLSHLRSLSSPVPQDRHSHGAPPLIVLLRQIRPQEESLSRAGPCIASPPLVDPIWIEDPYRQCRLTPLTSPASPALLDLTEEGQSRGMAGSMQAFFQKKTCPPPVPYLCVFSTTGHTQHRRTSHGVTAGIGYDGRERDEGRRCRYQGRMGAPMQRGGRSRRVRRWLQMV
ncbi:hypothetical protein D1007_00710 [Hordeum vulgare]|nr:hypothetical protein D1007_00710 [Hordeum vulgare]